MSWRKEDIPLLQEIDAPYRSGNVEQMRQLLLNNPHVLRMKEGTDFWLGMAAAEGKLDFVKMLVGLGIGVDESDQPGVVGQPLERAADAGHFDVVDWLIKHGAVINTTFQGKTCSFALSGAARRGHFDVVKILVEHGADVHASWMGINALMQATDYGHPEIAAYLRSKGAKDIRETVPPDYHASHARLIQEMVGACGPMSDWKQVIPGNPDVTIHLIPANKKCRDHVIFTIGLSDHRLPHETDPFGATELKLLLPKKWSVSPESLIHHAENWPIEWLKRAVDVFRKASAMPTPPLLLLNESNPKEPLSESSKQCGFLCHRAPEGARQMPDYRWIGYRLLFSIYPEEVDLIQTKGLDEFIKRLGEADIGFRIDLKRKNVGMK